MKVEQKWAGLHVDWCLWHVAICLVNFTGEFFPRVRGGWVGVYTHLFVIIDPPRMSFLHWKTSTLNISTVEMHNTETEFPWNLTKINEGDFFNCNSSISIQTQPLPTETWNTKEFLGFSRESPIISWKVSAINSKGSLQPKFGVPNNSYYFSWENPRISWWVSTTNGSKGSLFLSAIE